MDSTELVGIWQSSRNCVSKQIMVKFISMHVTLHQLSSLGLYFMSAPRFHTLYYSLLVSSLLHLLIIRAATLSITLTGA